MIIRRTFTNNCNKIHDYHNNKIIKEKLIFINNNFLDRRIKCKIAQYLKTYYFCIELAY